MLILEWGISYFKKSWKNHAFNAKNLPYNIQKFCLNMFFIFLLKYRKEKIKLTLYVLVSRLF